MRQPKGTDMRRFVNARTWDAATLAFNAVLVLVFFAAFWTLWGLSAEHLADAGGLPPMSGEGLRALAASGASALPRIGDWGLSWTYGVFAVGALILTVSGLRCLIVAARRFL